MRSLKAVVLSVLVLGACSGESEQSDLDARAAPNAPPRPRCADPRTSIVGDAVKNYVKLASPTPMRFLMAIGNDSALPEVGLSALQSIGPTYLFPPDAAQQAKVKAKLAEVGNYATLLVVLRDMRVTSGNAAIRLGGVYVGGKEDGKRVPSRSLNFACDSLGWHFTSAQEERTS